MAIRSPFTTLLLSMFSAVASLYVAGRLWQDGQERVYMVKELDRIIGQGKSAISVEDTLKIIACREQQKLLSSLERDLAAAKQEGFVSKNLAATDVEQSRKQTLVVIGVLTSFGRQSHRDAIRKAWMGVGAARKKVEDEKGIKARFVIGRSANHGENKGIDSENRQTNDFIILDNHVEVPEELPKKTKLFFAYAADNLDADFYAKINDNIFINIDALGNTLAGYINKPRVYIGCMKSGEVFSEPRQKWYEPDWWKFGDKKSYFCHASGEMIVISRALAKFISINRSALRTYAHDDISVGSWFIGLNVEHVDDRKFCCSYWSSGSICSGA